MKLRNRKTGEICKLRICTDGSYFIVATKKLYEYDSPTELYEEWEDCEEPKEYWTIDRNEKGGLFVHKVAELAMLPEWVECDEEYGIRFGTEEEAEKAVEKLRAIRRLNKCGFKFEGYTDRDRADGGSIVIYASVNIPNNNLLEKAQPAMLNDLDLLFGGGDD